MTECVPPAEREKKTLFIITMGGNDISNLTQDGIDGASTEDLWALTHTFVDHMRAAVRWATSPGRFPNGVYVVFGNMFEFTDGTGDVTACPAAGLAGFGNPWEDPDLLAEMVVWANEQFMAIATETGTDMIFMLEHFCGHGFNSENPEAPCYRGPGTENWFDLTCIHPTPTGHGEIARQFLSVVRE
jgi:lysophospholipase L1-like esterase